MILKARPTQMWLDEKLLEREGYTVEQVAEFLAEPHPEPTSRRRRAPGPARPNDPAFQAVFPTSTIEQLPCLPASMRAA